MNQARELEQIAPLLKSELKKDPRNKTLLTDLASCYYQLGKLSNAIKYLEKAHQYHKRDSDILHNLAALWQQQGNSQKATFYYQKVLALEPNDATTLANLSALLIEAGRLDEARSFLEKAVGNDASNLTALTNLGYLYTRMQIPRKASDSYAAAYKIEPADALIAKNYAHSLVECGELDLAEQVYQHALKTHPTHELISGLSNIYLLRGDHEQVIRLLEPYQSQITSSIQIALAYAEVCKKLNNCNEIIHALEQHLLAELSNDDQMLVNFSLGKLYDANRDYEKAFTAYQAGNQLSHRSFSIKRLRKKIDTLIAQFTPQLINTSARQQKDEIQLIFIVGMPRSGSTLVEQILATHPAVYAAGELPYIDDVITYIEQRWSNYPYCLAGRTQDELNDIAKVYLDKIRPLAKDKTIISDKLPGNFQNLGLIRMLFPAARIIHTQRNPADTCLSCYFQNFATGHSYSNDLTQLAEFYLEYRRIMQHWQGCELDILDIEYEAMIEDTESQVERLASYCKLNLAEHYQNFQNVERKVTTASYAQVRQPIYRSSVQRWQHYRNELAPLLAVLDIKD